MCPSAESGSTADRGMTGMAGSTKRVSDEWKLLLPCILLKGLCGMVFYVFTSPFCFVFYVLFLLGEDVEIIL